MLRFITKPHLSILDSILCLLAGLAVPLVGWWLSAVLLILGLLVSTIIERGVWS